MTNVEQQNPAMMSLQGRVAVISGATGGLGRVAAAALAAHGARLALLGTNEERLRSMASDLGLDDDRLLGLALDLTRPDSGPSAAAAVIEKFGKVDVVLHLIGGWAGGKPVPEVTDDDVTAMLAPHLWATLNLARAFVPQLVANGWGRVIAVSSPVAANPPPRQAQYAMAKAAQEALVLTLAAELRGSGVTANLVIVKAIDEKHERDTQPTERNVSWTTPEEIAAAILYLCSDEARVVNGARLPLHSG